MKMIEENVEVLNKENLTSNFETSKNMPKIFYDENMTLTLTK